MKNIFKVAALAVALIFSACTASTSDLAKQVQTDIIKGYKEKGTEITVEKNLVLVHQSGNDYTGMMTVVDSDGDKYELSVSVVYDGESYVWTAE